VTSWAHTPGPWTVEEYGDDETPTLVIHKDSDSRICFMATPGSYGSAARIEADARLIAAAPEMYAALKKIIADAESDDGATAWDGADIARPAIAKAEGR
jgi:hypothetical protein